MKKLIAILLILSFCTGCALFTVPAVPKTFKDGTRVLNEAYDGLKVDRTDMYKALAVYMEKKDEVSKKAYLKTKKIFDTGFDMMKIALVKMHAAIKAMATKGN